MADNGALIQVDPRSLTLYPTNYNDHPDGQINELARSLGKFGQYKNIVIWRGSVIAGHGLVKAAIKSNLPTVDARDMSHLTQAEAEALLVADNETARMAVVDYGKLKAMVEMAKAAGQEVPGVTEERLREIVEEAKGAGIGNNNGNGNTPVEDVELSEMPDLTAPFPYFGGKSRVASRIWKRFGEVQNYVEPFCGSAAVLLACPFDVPIVTLNDMDGFIANFWRAVAAAPDEVARWVDWPVNENDLFARHVWLIKRRGELVKSLETDPDYYDAKIAGWWCWGVCAWIGTGWCDGDGPWSVEGGEVVKLVDSRQLPHLGDAGQGVNRQLPHLGDAGQGVNRKLPHLGDAGQGVNRKLPHLGDAGRGVNRQLPHLGDAGQGVNRQLPELWGRGVHRRALGDGFEGGTCEAISANLHAYMQTLADKLRRPRVTCGDWKRVTTPSVTHRHGLTAILLDPPYGEGDQEYSAGGNQDKAIAAEVWAWAIENSSNPELRIAVCGYDDGRETPPGWSVLRWQARKGYQVEDTNSKRETVWFSPHCL